MAPAADGLGDRRVEDVGADRGGGLDPEDEDQQRRHQRAAAHAGHTDEYADAQSEKDDCRVHGCTCSSAPVQISTFLTFLVRSAESGRIPRMKPELADMEPVPSQGEGLGSEI